MELGRKLSAHVGCLYRYTMWPIASASPVRVVIVGARPRLRAVLLGLLLSGCVSIPLPMRGLGGANPAPALERKLVVGKEAPADLIAEDGTRCLTTKSRFKRTLIGSEAWCVWTGDGRPQRRLPRQ
jgi:hypothetical protein